MKKLIIFIFILPLLNSCEVLLKTANTVLDQNRPLTKEEVAKGLKSALELGVDTAIAQLGHTDGYYADALVRIELPEQARSIAEQARKVPGLDQYVNDLELQLNRSAEDATQHAAEIFKTAIRNMSIRDAMEILNGPDNAATEYLKGQSYASLTSRYKPVIDASLDKPLVGNISANKSWDEISSRWNSFAGSYAGKLLDAQKLDYDLSLYVSKEAVDGLFLKIQQEEKDIRTRADARVNELLKRVFAENQPSTLPKY